MDKTLIDEKLNRLITKQDVETVIKQAAGPDVEIINYHLKPFSEEKVGFFGSHKNLVVAIKQSKSNVEEVKTFFLKHIPCDNEQQASNIQSSNVFYKEVNFYKEIVPELTKSLNNKSSDFNWCPQCYLTKDDALLFEDLKSRSFTTKGKSLDIVCIKSALLSLAKLHASSILAEKRLGKNFLDLYPEVLKEMRDKNNRLIITGRDVAVGVAEYLGLETKNISQVCGLYLHCLSPSKTRRNVICHGDAWSFNLMFDDSQPLPKCMLVDFQLVRYLPQTTDVLLLIYLTSRREFREEYEGDLLKYYYDAFRGFLKENSEEVYVPTFDDIRREYEELRVIGLVTASYYFPINFIDGKLCDELTKGSDDFDSFWSNRVKLVLSLMQKDDNYKERIAEIITELVEKSEKLLNL